MTTSRRLPVATEQREFTIKVNGELLSRGQHLLAVSINNTSNRIAKARLVYQDGAASSSDFALSNTDYFIPGAEIEILAGSNDQPESLFKGLVVQHQLKIRHQSAPQLIVECRHKTTTMTLSCKDAYYYDSSDSEVIEQLFSDAGVNVEVRESGFTHKQQVQYRASDWDYCVLRAEANGFVILVKDDSVKVVEPTLSSPVCNLLFGATILDADLKINARNQYGSINASTWDPANQSLIEVQAEDSAITSPGNLSTANLADALSSDVYQINHPALQEDEAQQWVNAKQVYSHINRVSGRLKCEGMSAVHPGDTISLAGLGDRFNGDAYVTAVRHDYDLIQGWKTYLQIGGLESLQQTPTTPSQFSLLPAISGLQVGIVVSNEDPDKEHRIQVKMPTVSNDDDGTWARMASLDAGKDRGFFFRPDIGDEVVIGFLSDDPRQAIILGMLHSSAKPAPIEGSDDNHEKIYQSRSKMSLAFDDDNVVMNFSSPKGNSIELNEKDKHIRLQDQHGNSIQLNADGITLESQKAIVIKAANDIKIEATNALKAKSGSDVSVEGASSVEINGASETKVKGGVVKIN